VTPAAPVVIVGAGPCGLAVACALVDAGIPHLVLDAGCVAQAITQYPLYGTFFSTAEKLAIGGVPFTIAEPKPTRRDALAYYRGVVTAKGLQVRQYERVTAVSRTGDGGFEVVSHADEGARTTAARAVVIATGYFGTPNRLGVAGEDLPHVTHQYREGHPAFQREALVVGGGNSAVEAALDLARHGARVTVVHVGETFDRNIKPWIRPDFEARVREGTIAMRWTTRVTALRPGWATVAGPSGVEDLRAEHVFLMTGYTPAPGLLTGLGVPVDAETGVPAHDPATMETPVPGIFVAGVLVSGYDANRIFIENGREHGRLIATALAAR
jgi:thioredoxin reductase (NADPH)